MDENLLNDLNNKNKLKRRNALNQLQKIIELENFTLEVYNYYEAPLLSALSDESEINRHSVCIALETVLQKKLKPQSLTTYVIPTIRHQLCSDPIIEDCEENRLELLILLENMINCYDKNLNLHTSELCDILCSGLKDSYPEVVLKSCDCIIKLSTVLRTKFPMFCNSFLKYLIRCFRKYRYKVRVKALNTLECLFTCGNICEFEELGAELSKCFVDIPQVRMALLSFGHSLCIRMPDRYSYWSKILPFILFGLRDNDEEIGKNSLEFWQEIGKQYEIENEIKTSVRLHSDPEIFPEEVRALDFGSGCCALIERNFYRMFENLVVEARDWQEQVRLNALKLLTVCVLGLKENCLQYSKKLIDIIAISVSDNDLRVRKESLLCAKVLGNFLPPDLYIPLLEPGLWEEADGFFLIFSSLIETTPACSLEKHCQTFLQVLNFSNIGHKISVVKQEIIIEIFTLLFTNCKIEYFDASWFLSLLYVTGINHSVEKEVDGKLMALELAANSFGHESVQDFISKHMETCLLILNNDNIWFEEDESTFRVFLYLSRFEGFDLQLDVVSDILRKKIDFKSMPLVAFAVLRVLTEVFERVSNRRDHTLTNNWCTYIFQEHILEMLSYKQFRTGESLRLAAVSSLLSVVKSSDANATTFQIINECLDYLEGLISEDFVETRILTCNLIEVLLTKYDNFIDSEKTFQCLELLMKRLDDTNTKVRRVASSALANSLKFQCVSKSTLNEKSLRKIINNIAIYFREEDTYIKKNVAGILIDLKVMNRNILESELRSMESEDIFEVLN
ncbi:UNVERIFIED_CONTAM: hypothetical protein RMT77_010204 [Armadillidium vulgare]